MTTQEENHYYPFGLQMADKYSRFSPYNYAANDPVLLEDIDGRDIVLSFKPHTNANGETTYIGKDEVQKLLDHGLGGQFKAVLTQNKNTNGFSVTFEATKGGGDVSKLSDGQKAFYESLNGIANDHDVVVGRSVLLSDNGIDLGIVCE